MKFEDFIQDNLKDQRAEIDAAKMWDNVSHRIDKNKRRRRFFFWLFGTTGIIALLIGALAYQSPNGPTKLDTLSSNINMDPTSEDIVSPKDAFENNDKINESISNISNSILSNETELINENLSNASFSTITTTTNSKTPHENEIYIPHTKTSNSIDKSSKTISSNIPNTNSISSGNTVFIQSPLVTTAKNRQPSDLLNLDNTPLLDIERLDFYRLIPELNLIQTRIKNQINLDSNSKWALVAIAGLGLTNKTYNSTDIDFIAAKMATQSSLEHLQFSGLFSYQMNKRWSVSSGLDYLRQVEKIEWEGDYSITESGTYVSSIYWSDADTMIENFSEGEYLATYHRKIKKYNKRHFVNIPIIAEFNIGKKDRYIGIQAGVLANVFFKQNGIELNPMNAPESINTNEAKVSLQYMLGLNYNKSLTDKMNLIIGSSYRIAPKVETIYHSIAVQNQYQFINLNLGIQYKL